jgi:hypothetical protein
MRRIQELEQELRSSEKKIRSSKKKSTAVLTGFEGYLSSRRIQKVPLRIESESSVDFGEINLKKKKSRRRFKKAVKAALVEQDLENVTKLKNVSVNFVIVELKFDSYRLLRDSTRRFLT